MAVPWKVNSSSTYAFTQHSGYHKNHHTLDPATLLPTETEPLEHDCIATGWTCLVAQLCLSDSLQSHDCCSLGSSDHGDSPGKNIGVGCHAFLQEIFLFQGSNPHLLHCRWGLYPLNSIYVHVCSSNDISKSVFVSLCVIAQKQSQCPSTVERIKQMYSSTMEPHMAMRMIELWLHNANE